MKNRLVHIIQTIPIFIFLLPLFFMLHLLQDNYAPGLTSIALKQALIHICAGLLITAVFYLFFKNLSKAALLSFFLVSFNLFFGSFHDMLKDLFGYTHIIVRYVLIIPLVLGVFLLLIIWIRRSSKNFKQLFIFLNTTGFVLTGLAISGVIQKTIDSRKHKPAALNNSYQKCSTCETPDVYLIIADEYAGKQALGDLFSFDNSVFENDLANRGFETINNTKSNYNATIHSMASLFNMGYLNLYNPDTLNYRDIELCRYIVKQNNITDFFKKEGYLIKNISIFNFGSSANIVENHFYDNPSKIFTSQVFVNRFLTESGHHFISKKRLDKMESKSKLRQYKSDEMADSLTRKAVFENTNQPKFVYTHFVRPHGPFLFDRNGALFPDSILTNDIKHVKKVYPEYVLYTNKKLLELIDFIRSNSKKPPIILLLSDHGLRLHKNAANNNYSNMTICAIHVPGGKPSGLYHGISTVNIFRKILNSLFGQNLPLLPDSSIQIKQGQYH